MCFLILVCIERKQKKTQTRKQKRKQTIKQETTQLESRKEHLKESRKTIKERKEEKHATHITCRYRIKCTSRGQTDKHEHPVPKPKRYKGYVYIHKGTVCETCRN